MTFSDIVLQRGTHFLGGAEEAVFGGFLGGTEGFADGAEAEAFVVTHFKDDAFAGGQFRQGVLDASAQFPGEQAALGVVVGPAFFDGFEQIVFSGGGVDDGWFFLADLPFAEMIEADVGDDAIEPGGEVGIETEGMEVFVNAEESFLVDIAGFVG